MPKLINISSLLNGDFDKFVTVNKIPYTWNTNKSQQKNKTSGFEHHSINDLNWRIKKNKTH